MHDLADRLSNRVQLTTDGHRPYLEAVESAFGEDIDFAQLIKIYGYDPEAEKRYSPAKCLGTNVKTITGEPNPKHVLRRASEPHHANVDETVYQAHKRVQQESGDARALGGATLHVLQLREDSPELADDTGPSCWRHGPAVGA